MSTLTFQGSHIHTLLFPYLLYPAQYIAMSGSVFMTVGIALERYIAVHYPIGKKEKPSIW